jgi:hypothetical protein
MSNDMTHRAFFGDADRDFKLTPLMIVELERKTGAGIGGLCRRLFDREFSYSDITEIIRLALIGGGTAPKEADALVKAYVAERPLGETFPLAVSILETLWFGKPADKTENPDAKSD